MELVNSDQDLIVELCRKERSQVDLVSELAVLTRLRRAAQVQIKLLYRLSCTFILLVDFFNVLTEILQLNPKEAFTVL